MKLFQCPKLKNEVWTVNSKLSQTLPPILKQYKALIYIWKKEIIVLKLSVPSPPSPSKHSEHGCIQQITTCSDSQESQETKTFVAINSRKKPASFITYTAENIFSQQAIILQILQLDLRIKCGILHLLHKSTYKIWKTVSVIIHDFMWVTVGCFIFLFILVLYLDSVNFQ